MADQPSRDDNSSILRNGVKMLGLIAQALQRAFPQTTGVAATATGGAATLPANPVGFITVLQADGSTVLIPYYSP